MKRLSPDQLTALRAALAANLSLNRAAAEAKCSIGAAYRYRKARRLGLCPCGLPHDHPGACPRKPHRGDFVPVPEATRTEALRLRLDEDLSTPDIAQRLGIKPSAAYHILKGRPRRFRPYVCATGLPWTPELTGHLRRLYPTSTHAEILAAFPGRSWDTIERKANTLGIHRDPDARIQVHHPVHPLVARLRAARHAQDLTTSQLARAARLDRQMITGTELGHRSASLPQLAAWAAALGFELTLTPRESIDNRPERALNPPPPWAIDAPPQPPPRRCSCGAKLSAGAASKCRACYTVRPLAPHPSAPKPAALANPPEPSNRPVAPPARAPSADDATIAAYLALNGATRVPSIGDPALNDLPPLRWDPKTRRQTRRPADQPPPKGGRGGGFWGFR